MGSRKPDDEHRCTWIKSTGNRCRSPRSEDGGEYCPFHVRMAEHRAKTFVLAQHAPDLPLEEHLQLELKMSFVMVRTLELELQDLGLSTDTWLRDTKETEVRDGGPGGGYSSVKRAKMMGAHPLIITYLTERQHHLKVLQTCIGAGLAARHIAAVERFVESVLAFSHSLCEKLGRDPTDPVVRAAISEAMREMETAVRETPPDAGPRVIEA